MSRNSCNNILGYDGMPRARAFEIPSIVGDFFREQINRASSRSPVVQTITDYVRAYGRDFENLPKSLRDFMKVITCSAMSVLSLPTPAYSGEGDITSDSGHNYTMPVCETNQDVFLGIIPRGMEEPELCFPVIKIEGTTNNLPKLEEV